MHGGAQCVDHGLVDRVSLVGPVQADQRDRAIEFVVTRVSLILSSVCWMCRSPRQRVTGSSTRRPLLQRDTQTCMTLPLRLVRVGQVGVAVIDLAAADAVEQSPQ